MECRNPVNFIHFHGLETPKRKHKQYTTRSKANIKFSFLFLSYIHAIIYVDICWDCNRVYAVAHNALNLRASVYGMVEATLYFLVIKND